MTMRGPANSNWKGGRHIGSGGYVVLTLADGGRMYEHRFVMQQVLGRPLRDDEDVHHINHVRSDNRPENLQLMASKSEHTLLHHGRNGRWARDYDACIRCGTTEHRHRFRGHCTRCMSKYLDKRSKWYDSHTFNALRHKINPAP
jgi:hypothetical protein